MELYCTVFGLVTPIFPPFLSEELGGGTKVKQSGVMLSVCVWGGGGRQGREGREDKKKCTVRLPYEPQIRFVLSDDICT